MNTTTNLVLWTRADNYCGTNYENHFIGLSVTRDSCVYARANFAALLELLGGESETVIVARASHWACGWVETILVEATDSEASTKLDDALSAIESYPVLCEDTLMSMEQEDTEAQLEQYTDQWVDTVNKAIPGLSARDSKRIAVAVFYDDIAWRGLEEAFVNSESIERYLKSWEFQNDDFKNSHKKSMKVLAKYISK